MTSQQRDLPAKSPRPTLETEVVVVGAGPTGLTVALWLARHGVDVQLLERRRAVGIYPRAHLLNVRTMEVFAQLGVAEEIARLGPRSDRWRGVAWYTTLAGNGVGRGRRLGHIHAWGGGPDAPRYAEASPCRFSNLPQSQLDRLLLSQAQGLLGSHVRLYHEVLGVEQSDVHADVQVLDRESGEHYAIRAQYVVLADGGRNSLDMLGISMSGPRSLVEIVSFYAKMDLRGMADDDALLTYFLNPEGETVHRGALLSLNPRDTASDATEWLVSTRFPIGDPRRNDVALGLQRIRGMLGIDNLEINVQQVSHWQYEGVVANRFRVGRCFLAGDAAHRHPPTGGLGLNTGVQDAWNLGWKLVSVLRGGTSAGVLDSYERERMPIAAFNVAHSLRNAGRHAPIGRAVGMRDGGDANEGWAQVGVWESDTSAGAARREAVAAAVAANADDYSQLNVEAGLTYDSGFVVPDGTPPQANRGSVTRFVPSARPGHHLPHIWLGAAHERRSVMDLIGTTGMTLLVDASARSVWEQAAHAASARHALAISVADLSADTQGCDAFCAAAGLAEGWALLVRPDYHVAWRSPSLPDDPAAALSEACALAIRGHVHSSAQADLAELIAQTEHAGQPLRVGAAAAPALFRVVGQDS